MILYVVYKLNFIVTIIYLYLKTHKYRNTYASGMLVSMIVVQKYVWIQNSSLLTSNTHTEIRQTLPKLNQHISILPISEMCYIPYPHQFLLFWNVLQEFWNSKFANGTFNSCIQIVDKHIEQNWS